MFTRYLIGLFGIVSLTLAMTASERASFNGASTTMLSSRRSMATLWWVPPLMYQIPSASFSAVASGAGSVALRAVSGTGRSTAAVERTDDVVRSSTGYPPCVRTMCAGNCTPSKSR